MSRLIRLVFVCVTATFLSAVQASDFSASSDASPVKDLDEPLPEWADPRDPASARERACALYGDAHADSTRIRDAYDAMRTAMRLGDPDAALYIAKYFYRGIGVARDEEKARRLVQPYLARFTFTADSSAELRDRIAQVEDVLRQPHCGPAVNLTYGALHGLVPAGLVVVPQSGSLTGGDGGFLSAPDRPGIGDTLTAARSGSHPRDARLRACQVYQESNNDPARLAEAYLHMRTAADCGDEPAALYVSAYLRAGVGASPSKDLANHFIRRVLTRRGLDHDEWMAALKAFEYGECAPVDRYGAGLLNWRSFTPLN